MRPRLIHPVSVTIEPIDKDSSTWDAGAREQIPSLSRGSSVTIKAQVHWSRQGEGNPAPTGTIEKFDGHLVFLRTNLESASYVPAQGDRVAAIEGVEKNIYLTGNVQQRGQYRGAHHLVRCYFEDRDARRD